MSPIVLLIAITFFFAGGLTALWVVKREIMPDGKNELFLFAAPAETAKRIRAFADLGKTKKVGELFVSAFAVFEVVWKHHQNGGIVILRDRTGGEKELNLDNMSF